MFYYEILVATAAALLSRPERYLTACFDGLCLWAECVLPSLFPFMVITMLLIGLGAPQAAARPLKKFTEKLNLPPAALPLFLMSAASGYPAGSRMLYEYYDGGLIGERDAKKLAPLTSACGPLFALGTVGSKAFGGGYAGVKLFSACLLSVVGTSVIYSLLSKKSNPPSVIAPPKKRDNNVLFSAFSGAVNASLIAGGFICFFYTLSKIIADFNILMPLSALLSKLFGKGVADGLCAGLCEATGGCFAVASAGGFFALPCAGFLMTFGGASILAQQLCYVVKCKVKASFFILFKFAQGLVCFALLCLFSLF